MLLNQIRSGKGVFLMAAKLRRRLGNLSWPTAQPFHSTWFSAWTWTFCGWARKRPFPVPITLPLARHPFQGHRRRVDERAHTTKVVVWETTQTLCDFTSVNITTLVSLFLKRWEKILQLFNFTHLRSCALKSPLRTKRHFQDGWGVSIIL